MATPSPPPHEESAAELLDQVMRGERFVWLPPGGFVYACVIPCLGPAAVSISWMLVSSVSKIGGPNPSMSAFYWMMGLGLALVAIATVPHVLVLRGYSVGRSLLIRYIRVLALLAAVLSAGAGLGWLDGPWFMVPTGLVALGVAHTLVTSQAYLAVTSFFEIKRRYRTVREREADAILAKGRIRRGRRQRK